MENSSNNGMLTGALILGVLIGGALGVLFAPDKGADTRKKLFKGIKDAADDVDKSAKDLAGDVDKIQESIKDVREKVRK